MRNKSFHHLRLFEVWKGGTVHLNVTFFNDVLNGLVLPKTERVSTTENHNKLRRDIIFGRQAQAHVDFLLP